LCIASAPVSPAFCEGKGAPARPTPLGPGQVELVRAGTTPSPPPATPARTAPAVVAERSPAREQDPREIFMRGNRFYESGEYEAAREEYEKLERAGYAGANLFFNLGNAFFKLDRKGMAILFYRRALKLRPRDQDARSNLDYALSLIGARVEPQPRPWLIGRWNGMVGFFNLREWLSAAAVAYWLLCGTLVVLIYIPSWRRPLLRTAGALVLVLALAVAASISRAYLEGQEEAVILAKEAKVHYGPSEKDVIAFILHEGITVEIENVKGDWYQVSLPDGKAGWVKREECGVI